MASRQRPACSRSPASTAGSSDGQQAAQAGYPQVTGSGLVARGEPGQRALGQGPGTLQILIGPDDLDPQADDRLDQRRNLPPARARPLLFSSARGATQVRDPATPQALGYVRQMMLNMDPPDHFRLRRLLSRAFTRRAVAQLEHRIRGHARAICDRVFTRPRGECDFAKDVAADLPLLTLADVLGACIALLEHADAQDELRADPALMASAAEEMLRWWTPVMTFRRTATGGVHVAARHGELGVHLRADLGWQRRRRGDLGEPVLDDVGRRPRRRQGARPGRTAAACPPRRWLR